MRHHWRMIALDGLEFRDLDHDGLVAPYEDWRLPIAERVDDLLGRLELAENAGLMLHGTLPAVGQFGVVGRGDADDEDDARPLLDAIDQGLISEGRVDASVRRVLTQKFQLAASTSRSSTSGRR